jgi:predicted O-methyltransferase YrrM
MSKSDSSALRLHELDRAVWCLAAVVTAAREDEPTALALAALLDVERPENPEDRHWLAATAAAPLLQASRFIAGGRAWDEQDDEALLAQGTASAAAGRAVPQFVLPQLAGAETLRDRPARMLDVGVGAAAMAVALCRELPQLSIVGLDVLERPLELARHNVVAAGMQERIELRKLSVADLDDADAFDLAWVPAPFVPRAPLEQGLTRIATALRPGGWVLLGHGRFGADPIDDAVTRFKTVVYGGTPLDDDEAQTLLRTTGFVEVFSLASPPGAPALTAGRRPSR